MKKNTFVLKTDVFKKRSLNLFLGSLTAYLTILYKLITFLDHEF